jgi:hypothetical protein
VELVLRREDRTDWSPRFEDDAFVADFADAVKTAG